MRKIIYFLLPVMLLLACKQGKQQDLKSIPSNMPPEILKVTRLIMADSTKPELYYERAKLYLDNKEGKKALADINKAIKLNPKESKYFVTQGDAYLLDGNARQCKAALEQAIALNNDEIEAYLKLAELSLYFKDYETVFMQLQNALKIDANNSKAYFIKGFAQKEKGDTLGAVKSFQKAVDLNQQYYDAYIQLGMLYTVNENKLALDYLNNALTIRPNSTEAMYFKGLYYQQTDQLNEAMAEYHKILKIDPKHKFSQFNLGYIHMFYLRAFLEATKYFTKAVEIDPAYFEAWYNRGYSYELAGDIQNARADYNKALEVKPAYPLAVAGLKRLDAGDKAFKK